MTHRRLCLLLVAAVVKAALCPVWVYLQGSKWLHLCPIRSIHSSAVKPEARQANQHNTNTTLIIIASVAPVKHNFTCIRIRTGGRTIYTSSSNSFPSPVLDGTFTQVLRLSTVTRYFMFCATLGFYISTFRGKYWVFYPMTFI